MTEPKRAMALKYAHVPPMHREVISRQMAYYTELFGMRKYSMTPWSPTPQATIKPETLARMTRPMGIPTPRCGC